MSDKIIEISVAKDFTLTPGARYRSDGKFSGEQFYEEVLKPNIDKVWMDDEARLVVDIGGTYQYASSFWSEVSIRIVSDYIDKAKIFQKVEFKNDKDPLMVETIIKFIDEAN